MIRKRVTYFERLSIDKDPEKEASTEEAADESPMKDEVGSSTKTPSRQSSQKDKLRKVVNSITSLKRPGNKGSRRSSATSAQISQHNGTCNGQTQRTKYTKSISAGEDSTDELVVRWGETLKKKRQPRRNPPAEEPKTEEPNIEEPKNTRGDTEKPAPVPSDLPERPNLADVEDDFGLNEFNEDSEDNYVMEVFNRDGEIELMKVEFEINKRTLSRVDEEWQLNEILENGTNECLLVDTKDHPGDQTFVYWEFGEVFDRTDFPIINATSICSPEEGTVPEVTQDPENSAEKSEDRENVQKPQEIDEEMSKNAEDPENSGKTANKEIEGVPTDLPKASEIPQLRLQIKKGQKSTSSPPSASSDINFYENTFFFDNRVYINKENGLVSVQNRNLEEPTTERIQMIIRELLKTENNYVKGLEIVVNKYISYIEKNCPTNLLGKATYIFGNITTIYENSRKFYKYLQVSTYSVDAIALCFLNSIGMFQLYPIYSRNKPKADAILKDFDTVIKERQIQLGDKLDLSSYLLTPIQRLGKYVLLLENIDKELKKHNMTSSVRLLDAILMIKEVMRAGNDKLAVDSIKMSPIDLTLYGSFIMRENFTFLKPKKMEAMVFLFSKVIVITMLPPKPLEEFIYYTHLLMSDLTIAIFEDDPVHFNLLDYPKGKKFNPNQHTYVLMAKSPKVKNDWTLAISNLLWEQFSKAKQLQMTRAIDEGRTFTKIRNVPRRQCALRKTPPPVQRSQSIFYTDCD